MIRFSLFGIPVEIQPWFWLVLALIGGALGAATTAALISVCLFVLAGFISIMIHEFGHALTSQRYGARPSITLHGFGGYAVFPGSRFTRTQDFIVTAAGPAVQIVLGLLALLAFFHAALPTTSIREFFWYLGVISLFWAVLNLVPVIPLDGGRLMASILGPARGVFALKVSMITAIAVGVLMLVFMKSFLFPIFLGMMAYQNWQELQTWQRR